MSGLRVRVRGRGSYRGWGRVSGIRAKVRVRPPGLGTGGGDTSFLQVDRVRSRRHGGGCE